MTEQETEAFAARLTRIWRPNEVEVEYDPSPSAAFYYRGDLDVNITLEVDHDFRGIHFYMYFTIPYSGVCLAASMSEGMRDIYRERHRKLFEAHKPLLDEWLPFFRRSCWLSGLPIEASAHEKAEWMQGFTCEELESWNLKV